MRRSKPEDLDEGACRRRALDLLARREHSRFELERKLTARSFPHALIAQVLDRLEESGALVAARFTDSFVRSRLAKGQGPARIRAELLERGIDKSRADEVLRTGEIDWVAAARSVRGKRFGAVQPSDFKERARQARFLQYRGFESSHIHAALEVGEDSD